MALTLEAKQALVAEGHAVARTAQSVVAAEYRGLTGTQITDAGLAHLASLSKLRELWIGQTAVTDAGLEHLSGLKNLETLDVSGTKVTLEGFQRLKQALPRLETKVSDSPQ